MSAEFPAYYKRYTDNLNDLQNYFMSKLQDTGSILGPFLKKQFEFHFRGEKKFFNNFLKKRSRFYKIKDETYHWDLNFNYRKHVNYTGICQTISYLEIFKRLPIFQENSLRILEYLKQKPFDIRRIFYYFISIDEYMNEGSKYIYYNYFLRFFIYSISYFGIANLDIKRYYRKYDMSNMNVADFLTSFNARFFDSEGYRMDLNYKLFLNSELIPIEYPDNLIFQYYNPNRYKKYYKEAPAHSIRIIDDKNNFITYKLIAMYLRGVKLGHAISLVLTSKGWAIIDNHKFTFLHQSTIKTFIENNTNLISHNTHEYVVKWLVYSLSTFKDEEEPKKKLFNNQKKVYENSLKQMHQNIENDLNDEKEQSRYKHRFFCKKQLKFLPDNFKLDLQLNLFTKSQKFDKSKYLKILKNHSSTYKKCGYCQKIPVFNKIYYIKNTSESKIENSARFCSLKCFYDYHIWKGGEKIRCLLCYKFFWKSKPTFETFKIHFMKHYKENPLKLSVGTLDEESSKDLKILFLNKYTMKTNVTSFVLNKTIYMRPIGDPFLGSNLFNTNINYFYLDEG